MPSITRRGTSLEPPVAARRAAAACCRARTARRLARHCGCGCATSCRVAGRRSVLPASTVRRRRRRASPLRSEPRSRVAVALASRVSRSAVSAAARCDPNPPAASRRARRAPGRPSPSRDRRRRSARRSRRRSARRCRVRSERRRRRRSREGPVAPPPTTRRRRRRAASAHDAVANRAADVGVAAEERRQSVGRRRAGLTAGETSVESAAANRFRRIAQLFARHAAGAAGDRREPVAVAAETLLDDVGRQRGAIDAVRDRARPNRRTSRDAGRSRSCARGRRSRSPDAPSRGCGTGCRPSRSTGDSNPTSPPAPSRRSPSRTSSTPTRASSRSPAPTPSRSPDRTPSGRSDTCPSPTDRTRPRSGIRRGWCQ